MSVLTRTFEIEDITSDELAELFANLDDHAQARFFAAVERIARDWPGAGWCQQSCSIAQRLTHEGRFVIQKLAEHAGLIPDEQVSA